MKKSGGTNLANSKFQDDTITIPVVTLDRLL